MSLSAPWTTRSRIAGIPRVKNLAKNGPLAGEHRPARKEAHEGDRNSLTVSASSEAAVGRRPVRGGPWHQAGESSLRARAEDDPAGASSVADRRSRRPRATVPEGACQPTA